MSYLQCSRCGLQIRVQALFRPVENCPRCMGRSATVSPLVQSRDWTSPAARWGANRTAVERGAEEQRPRR